MLLPYLCSLLVNWHFLSLVRQAYNFQLIYYLIRIQYFLFENVVTVFQGSADSYCQELDHFLTPLDVEMTTPPQLALSKLCHAKTTRRRKPV